MNREVLFRGKRRDNEKWTYGAYCHYNDVFDDGRDDCSYIIEQHTGEHFPFRQIITSTLGQYTGLSDRNGTTIFEGDILKSVAVWLRECKNGVVAFKDGAFGFTWNRGGIEVFHPFVSVCNIEYEVIGNIHDNPELMEDENG